VKWPQQDSDRDDMALPLKMNVVAELFKMRSYENGMVGREKFETKDCIRKGMAVISRYWVFGVEIEENWAFAVEFEVEMRLIEAGTKSKRAEEGYCFSVDLKHRGFYVRINN
jgi:hypothetical protein